MKQCDVEGQALGERNRPLDGIDGFAWQTDDEVSPVLNAGLLRPHERLLRPVGIDALA